MTNTIALFSSSRRDGNTGQLMDAVLEQANVDFIDLASLDISEFDYEHRNIDDDFLPLIKKILNYDKIIFASPVYWYSVTPTMKTFLDRISDLLDLPKLLDLGRQLRGKKAYVLCTSVHEDVSSLFIDAFKKTFAYLGMPYGGYVHADCTEGYQTYKNRADLLSFIDSIN
mgnify:CR=1 FL=1